MTAEVLWSPQAGPQTRFLASSAFEKLYGGAVGGGKTEALRNGLLEQVHIPEYRALFLRQTYPELEEVLDRCHREWPQMGAKWNAERKQYRWPSGALIEFGFFETAADITRYQGREFGVIAFDEIGNLADERSWLLLMSRCRSRSKKVRRYMIASANPGGVGEGWIFRRWVNQCDPSGTPLISKDKETGYLLTRAFFAAKVEDNPALLDADPGYIARLNELPPTLRDQLRLGLWGRAGGLALPEVDPTVHLVAPYAIPRHWHRFGAFDWGYDHPFSFGHYAVDENGRLVCVDTIGGRGLMPRAIAQAIRETTQDFQNLRYIVSGVDVFSDYSKARGDNTPTIAQQFAEEGVHLTEANTARVQGLNNLRRYLSWQRTVRVPDPLDPHNILKGSWGNGLPNMVFFDTPGNREVIEVLRGLALDPRRREDALKKNADREGNGGDDHYDQVRYAAASRPFRSMAEPEPDVGAFTPAAYEAALARRVSRRQPDSNEQVLQQLEALYGDLC